MGTQEIDKKKAIERSNSYREMMNSWAWKDFVSLLESIQKEGIDEIDRAFNLTGELRELGINNGIAKRAVISRIFSEINFIIDSAS